MSKSPRDLLRRHGAPLPRAATVLTEIRTDGFIEFGSVAAPEHQRGVVSGSLHEWRSRLSFPALDELRAFLTTGNTWPETLIENWMKTSNLGSFIGVFVQTGGASGIVRALFAYTQPQVSGEDINKAWAQLVEQPRPDEQKASAAIKTLRSIMVHGQDFTECGLLALSTLDYGTMLGDRGRLPFHSVDSV